MSTLGFHGAAGTVTGSCMLLQHQHRGMLIDCGLFQGSKTLKALNYDKFPFDPRALDAVILTHAHIDHSGLLPKLARDGFAGKVIATPGTRDLLSFLLPDAGSIQESEVERLNRRRQQRGEEPLTPIYTKADAETLLTRLQPVDYGIWLEPMAGVRARFWNAGHILGSASIEIELARAGAAPLRLLASGDLGSRSATLEEPATGPRDLDWVICESTYGDKERPPLTPDQRRAALQAEVSAALAAGGNLVIPVFAVERTQELLFDLGVLCAKGALPEVPIFLDSPLAVRATEVFAGHIDVLGEAAGQAQPFARRNFHFVVEAAESKALNRVHSGAIILAASGMCDAGRIRHHLKQHLWRRQSTVLLVGYQAKGTLGRLLQDGIKAVRIEGEELRVAARIRQLDVYSAHADGRELVEWVARRGAIARGVILTHGEEPARAGLARALLARLGARTPILRPSLDSSLALDAAEAPVLGAASPRLPSQAVDALDWHNRYAELSLKINQRLRELPDQAGRDALLAQLYRSLGAETRIA